MAISRKPGSKNVAKGSRFKSYEGKFPIDTHVRLTKHMLTHTKFRALSNNAKALYCYMKLWAGGRDEVEFAASMVGDMMAPPTFRKARDELVNAGFIEYTNRHCARDKKESGHYQFTARWYFIILTKPPDG